MADDNQVGSTANEMVAVPTNDTLISIVSLYEIVPKVRIGKLQAGIEEIINAVEREGFTVLDVGMLHLVALAGLSTHHRDPFDYILIAQAITEDATFMSEDQNVAWSLVRTVTCSGSAA